MNNKMIYIKLKLVPITVGQGCYKVEQLRNAARVSIEGPINGRHAITHFRVGDSITHSQADTLCGNRNYEVTVTI